MKTTLTSPPRKRGSSQRWLWIPGRFPPLSRWRTAKAVVAVAGMTTLLSATPPPLPNFPPLTFHPPKPARQVLPNGIVLFLLEDHELPLIKVHVLARAGTQYDPPDKIGLGSLLGPAMTEGGSDSYKPEDIQKLLDTTGASLSFGIEQDKGSGTMSCRAADFNKVFAVFADLLRHPLFRKDFLEVERSKALESLRRLNDEPAEVSRREFRRVIYGPDHPYARIPTPDTLDRIRREDLLEMHRHTFRPNALWLAVTGDFQSEALKKQIDQALGSWPASDWTPPALPTIAPTTERRLFYIQKPINQSQIRLGHLGLARHSPDHFAWQVFNELWGGSAASRLFQIVREQKGLAYSVGSVFSEFEQPGLILAVSQTRGPETSQAIQSILDISRDVTRAPFSDKEIQAAKETIRNQFIENYTSSAQIVSHVMEMEYFGYPRNYLDTYTDRIAQVTRGDLERVAARYLHPDRMTILVVGDLSTFDKPLSRFGQPQEIKLREYAHEEP